MSKTEKQEFSSQQFEKKLQALKDSQESINQCCHWCLDHRTHHKQIVSSWLNVLKRVKTEQRLTLFYLANDVIQYSKRKNYEFVESWGTTLQKATTLVRDERVKHKILRIFKIWEERGVYSEEFIGDLCGLISANTVPRKTDDPHEFQSSYLISKIRNCSSLENDTDTKLQKLKEHNPKINLDGSELCASLKDRAHVDDVEREVEDYIVHMDDYVNALKLEIKARSNLVSLLMQAETQLESDRRDVKLVANAYKAFATRVKNVKRKLDELIPTLSSPIPSPDINAPSPSPDSDIDLPNTPTSQNSSLQNLNVGYYNPVPITTSETTSFTNNGFSSFIGSNMPFNLQNFDSSTLFTQPTSTQPPPTQTTNTFTANSTIFPSVTEPPLAPNLSQPPLTTPLQAIPTPVGVPPPPNTDYQPLTAPSTTNYEYNSNHLPLPPPPMPPFSKNESDFGLGSAPVFTGAFGMSETSNFSSTNFQPTTEQMYTERPPPYVPPSVNSFDNRATGQFAANSDIWHDNQDGWLGNSETPESPPNFEKEGYNEPIEYHDTGDRENGMRDVDHRLMNMSNRDNDAVHRGKDVDHRNLITLTGSSPSDSRSTKSKKPTWHTHGDQDYRNQSHISPLISTTDQDYRINPEFNMEHLKLPPPPPPPSKTATALFKKSTNSPRKLQDNVESIDMDLSDDEQPPVTTDNLKIVVDSDAPGVHLEPPPPLPDFLEDVDAQNLLDDIDGDLNTDEFSVFEEDGTWNKPPPPPPLPPQMHVAGPPPPLMNIPPPPPNAGWMEQAGYVADFGGGFRGRGNVRGNFNNRGNRDGGEFRGGGRGRAAGWRGPMRMRMRRGYGRSRSRGNFRGFPGGF